MVSLTFSELPATPLTNVAFLDADVLHMSIFGINFIILNSMQATKDLLEKRGKIYSARMSLPMFEIAEYTKLVAFETNTKRYVPS